MSQSPVYLVEIISKKIHCWYKRDEWSTVDPDTSMTLIFINLEHCDVQIIFWEPTDRSWACQSYR